MVMVALAARDRAAPAAVCRGWWRLATAATATDAMVFVAAAEVGALYSPPARPLYPLPPPDLAFAGVPSQRLLLGAAHIASCELLLRDRAARVAELVREERRRVMGCDSVPRVGAVAAVHRTGDTCPAIVFGYDRPECLVLHLPLLGSTIAVPMPLPAPVLRGLAAPIIADAARRLCNGEDDTPLCRIAQLMAAR